MRRTEKHTLIAGLAIVATALLTFACMSIEDIIFPDDPKVNSEIEITVKIRVSQETDDKAHLVFGVLAPKSWNIAQNASLTFTTSGYVNQGYSEIVDEPLVLVDPTEVEKTTQLPWSTALQSKLGLMDNYGEVEWVAFKSSTLFDINDQRDGTPIDATVKIKLMTGPDNIRFNMGFSFCGDNWGMDEDSGEGRYKRNEKSKVLEVTGGSGPVDDFTKIKLVSTTPSVFRYGDIFAVNFQSETDEGATALKGADKIYLCGTATLADGTEKTVDKASDANLMVVSGPISYMKYIYPRHFFGLGADAVITDIKVWFINGDGSVKVDDSGEGFALAQSAN